MLIAATSDDDIRGGYFSCPSRDEMSRISYTANRLVITSRPARQRVAHIRVHARRHDGARHFSSDLTLIAHTPFIVPRAMLCSLSAKVFELASRLLSLWHHLHRFLRVHLLPPRPRPFFRAPPWHVFRAKKSSAPNEGRKRETGEGRRNQFIILEQTSSERADTRSECDAARLLFCNNATATMTGTLSDNRSVTHKIDVIMTRAIPKMLEKKHTAR